MVGAQGVGFDLGQFFWGSQAHSVGVGVADEGVVERVGLIEEFDEWGREGLSLWEAQSLDDAAGGAVSDDDFEGDDLDFVGEEALVIEAFDVV